MCTNIGVL